MSEPVIVMRTPDEIVQRCLESRERVFDFQVDVLAPYLTFEQAKPLLNDTATAESWTARPLTRESILEEMREYMAFAWGKVQGHRGLSAGRSLNKMAAWLWLLGEDEASEACENGPPGYAQYGAPRLAVICRKYGWPIPDSDSRRIANMIEGRPCRSGCNEGCGQ